MKKLFQIYQIFYRNSQIQMLAAVAPSQRVIYHMVRTGNLFEPPFQLIPAQHLSDLRQKVNFYIL